MRERLWWAFRRVRDALAAGFVVLAARIAHDNVMPGSCYGVILESAGTWNFTFCGLLYHETAILEALLWGLGVAFAVHFYRWQNRHAEGESVAERLRRRVG